MNLNALQETVCIYSVKQINKQFAFDLIEEIIKICAKLYFEKNFFCAHSSRTT